MCFYYFVINTDHYAGEVAEIEIMDIAGKRMGVLFYNTLVKGTNFIPSDLAAGAYLVKVNVSNTSFASIVVLVK